MGYSTIFTGSFRLNKPLTDELKQQWKAIYDNGVPKVKEPLYPSDYLQWIFTPDGMEIKWDGEEKFYGYVIWLKWIVDKFLIPNGYILNGTVKYQADDDKDERGFLIVQKNIIKKTHQTLTKIIERYDTEQKIDDILKDKGHREYF